MKTKEQWIEESLESLDRIKKAECPEGLVDRLSSMSMYTKPSEFLISGNFLLKVAAGFALMILLNIFSMHYYSKIGTTEHKPVETLATDYFSYIETIKF